MENKVQLEVFEGPLDLLLYLVKKEEVDIYEVNLAKIAAQFIEYVDAMRQLDLDLAGEFLVMAATLMYIKSRELLPVDQQALSEEPEDEIDPRWELIRQLVEYKKFKDAAGELRNREIEQESVYPRQPGKPDLEPLTSPAQPQAKLLDLLNAVNAVLKRFTDRVGATRDVFQDKWTVTEKIELLLRLIEAKPRLKFSELFANAASRAEVVVTFLAVLELIRLKKLRAYQPEAFAEIEICLAEPDPAGSLPDPSRAAEQSAEGANGTAEAPPPSEQWN